MKVGSKWSRGVLVEIAFSLFFYYVPKQRFAASPPSSFSFPLEGEAEINVTKTFKVPPPLTYCSGCQRRALIATAARRR